jgi:hypothetical protein
MSGKRINWRKTSVDEAVILMRQRYGKRARWLASERESGAETEGGAEFWSQVMSRLADPSNRAKEIEGSPAYGISWDSPQGKRWVERVHNGRAFIRTEGSPLAQILSESEIGREMMLDRSRWVSRTVALEEEARALTQATLRTEEKRGLYGFTTSMPAVKARKIEETLDKQQGFSGHVMPRRVFVEQTVESGAVVTSSQKGDRRLVFPDGSFFTERDVTKIALDYADHLIRLRERGGA